MRIAVVLGCNTHWAPYYYRYESWLTKNNVEFDVILWNRENIAETVKGQLIEFKSQDKGNDKNPGKVFKFFSFSRFVKKQIKKRAYDKIVFLGLQGCAATLNVLFYKKHYANLYWLDIRDYHYEWFKPYYLMEKKLIENAAYVAISSKGFESFLPRHSYGYIHNIDPNIDSICCNYAKVPDDAIRISFIGNVRYFAENVTLIRRLGNDFRFKLQYFGPGAEEIRKYCEANNIKNVRFEGPFKQEKTKEFYECTDIINNIYGNAAIETTTALSNKLYYSIFLRMPIIVSSKTYMEEICKPFGTAIAFEDDHLFANRLFDWYQQNVKAGNGRAYDEFRKKIEKEDHVTQEAFLQFLAN